MRTAWGRGVSAGWDGRGWEGKGEGESYGGFEVVIGREVDFVAEGTAETAAFDVAGGGGCGLGGHCVVQLELVSCWVYGGQDVRNTERGIPFMPSSRGG